MSGGLKDTQLEHEENRSKLQQAHKEYAAAVLAKSAAEETSRDATAMVDNVAARVRSARTKLLDSAARLKPLIDSDVSGLLGAVDLLTKT